MLWMIWFLAPAHGMIVQPPSAVQPSAAQPSAQSSPQANTQSTATPNGSSTIPSGANGIPPTPTPAFPGLPVPQSASGLPSGTPPSPQAQDLRTPVGLTPSQVADLQARLMAAGFYHGPIDGALNGPTRSGIRQFQEAARIPVTGVPDGATTGALGVSSAAAAAAAFGTPFPISPSADSTLFVQP
jgi:Putative peptidoglycan binding domain